MSTTTANQSSEKLTQNEKTIVNISGISGIDIVNSLVGSAIGLVVILGFSGPILVMYPVIDKVVLQACQHVNSICAAIAASETTTTDTGAPPVKTVQPLTTQNQLSSSYGINYRELQILLQQQNWEAANEQTTAIMSQLFTEENLDTDPQLPLLPPLGKDFQTLNTLWTQYSDGHFGFARQSQIWADMGGSRKAREAIPQIYQGFAERVGWGDRSVENLDFSLDAPPGHLPTAFVEILSFVEDDRIGTLNGFYRDRSAGYCSEWRLEGEQRWDLWGDRSVFRGKLSLRWWRCGVKVL